MIALVVLLWALAVAVLLVLYPPATAAEMRAGYDRVAAYLDGRDPDAG